MKSDRGDLVLNLFAPKRQYRIPLYQRCYVWDKSDWETLWTDIEAKFDCRRKGRKTFSRHFTGTILTYQDRSEDNPVAPYQILDGQQRLITFQIILCAIRDICRSEGYAIASGSRIPSPDSLIRYQGSDKMYNKLCPKEGLDADVFCVLADPEKKVVAPFRDNLLHGAYRHFRREIKKCVKENFAEIDILYEAVVMDFDIVQINLKDRVDLEKIFASLNSTGKMLDEFDRLRMDLFLRAGKNGDGLYSKYWQHFDTDPYWAEQDKTEMFLRHFLEARLGLGCFAKQKGQEPKAFDLYQTRYRKNIEGQGKKIDYEFQELKRYSKIYQTIDTHPKMQFYKLFNIVNWHPFILFLLGEKKIEESELKKVFRILESYTIRRMLCYGPEFKSPNKYDFLPRIKKQLGKFDSVKKLVQLLSDGPRPHEWPRDNDIEPIFNYQDTKNIDVQSYILYRIECHKSGNPPQQFDDMDHFNNTYIPKHLRPLNWEGTWHLPIGEGKVLYNQLFPPEYRHINRRRPSEADLCDKSQPYKQALKLGLDRKGAVKSAGNLTILEVHLAQSPDPFKKSKLELNKEIFDDDNWDVKELDKRTEKLYELFCEIWPSADSITEEITGNPPTQKVNEIIALEPHTFMTYTGCKQLSEISLEQHHVAGKDSEGSRIRVKKTDILFAFPSRTSSTSDSYFQIDSDVKNEKLIPVEMRQAKNVPNNELQGAMNQKLKSYMKLITRGGHILYGTIEDFDRYCIYMQSKSQTVIVYRHGLYNYEFPAEFCEGKLDKMMRGKNYTFITGKFDVKLSQIKTSGDRVTGTSGRGYNESLRKKFIQVAIPTKAWEKVSFQIHSEQIPEEMPDSPYLIKDWILNEAKSEGYNVEFIICNRDEDNRIRLEKFQGKISDFDEFVIYLQIDEDWVGVYRHGLYSLSTTQVHKSSVKEFLPESDSGFIKFSNKKGTNDKGIFVDLDEVDDGLSELKVGQEVKFNVKHTAEKGLQAINVKLVEP